MHYKLGKNEELGKILADYLKATIDPNEFESVNLVLLSIRKDDFDLVINFVKEEQGFELSKNPINGGTQVRIYSRLYNDHIIVKYFDNVYKLQIQGRPLSSYRLFTYYLSDLLDLKGLEKVLSRQENGQAQVVRRSVAEDFLKLFFGTSFEKLDDFAKNHLISAWMIKSSTPDLLDYSFLLMPEVRVLEGALKKYFYKRHKTNWEREKTFGICFKEENGVRVLRECYAQKVEEKSISVLESAYNFYHRERHRIAHADPLPNFNRVLTEFSELEELSKECLGHIKLIYDLI